MNSIKLPKLKAVDPNKPKKKTILLLSDDLRLHSGVGTMSREIVLGTSHIFNWVQVAGAINHPDKGKRFDVSDDINKEMGIDNASVILYPVDDYGNAEIVRQLMTTHNPDAILHFTDPRFWGWLYQMEHEIRQYMPLMYLNIWDDLPYPHWNENFYESCDLLMAISKQTYNINNQVCQRKPRVEGVDLTYVQHGINDKVYKPISETDAEFSDYFNFISDRGYDKFDSIFFFNSRNIRRKMVSDLILSYRLFCDSLSKEEASQCLLLLHTDPVDNNGTDLPALIRALCPNYNVQFSTGKLPNNQLNYLYNVASLTCQPSSAEGFGLSVMESIMSGTPVLGSVIGGIQDQLGFEKDDGTPVTLKDFSAKWPSNSDGKYTKHGEWAFPCWPQINLQGSPMTPYIYDSRPSVKDIAKQLKNAHSLGRTELKRRGLIGREWAIKNGFNSKGMCQAFIDSVVTCFENFKPRERFTVLNTEDPKTFYPDGIIFGSIDKGE
jgi:glycosyltransferase involved in cell wall biosynthesis|tara:strand:+ start:2002 stop:3480 length:1479 start_codon:yes stop_codon:yes gene_type:complete